MAAFCKFERTADGKARCSTCHDVLPLPPGIDVDRLHAKCKGPRGFGDTVARFTRATGIAAAVDGITYLTGIDCRCAERQEALNKLFPYREDKTNG